MLDNYFTTVLHKRIDTSSVDVNAIGMNITHWSYDVTYLYQLTAGYFIFSMSYLSDNTLKCISFGIFMTAKSNDPEEILNLLELVVGVAVMCEDKNVFIPKIFELNDHSQVCDLF